MEPTPEISSAEAVQKVKESAEALQKAQAEQIELANLKSEERITQSFTNALKHAFSADSESGQKKFIDITRIPLICQDISTIENRLGNIEDNIKWGVRIVIGAVILAIISVLLK